MNKLEAFKALAEGKKVRSVGMIPNDYYYGYYVLDTYGNIDDDESYYNWNDDKSNNWEIYEPPKKKVKKKVKAWINVYENNFKFNEQTPVRNIYYSLDYAESEVERFKQTRPFTCQEIEFEIMEGQ